MTEPSAVKEEPKLTQKEKIEKVEEALKQLSLEPNYKVSMLQRLAGLTIDSEGKTNSFPIYAQVKLKKISKEAVQDELQQKYSEIFEQYGESEIEFESVSVGEPYIKFPVSTLTKDETFDLIHKPGEIWLLDFWATWCGPCQPAMAHNQEMLEHHPEWKGKVRILGISLDKTKDVVIKRVEDRKWTSVEHYFSPGAWQGVGPKSYGVNGIPFVALVGMDGNFVKLGHPSECNLEETINSLLKGEKIAGPKKEEPQAEVKATVSLEDAEKIMKDVCSKNKPQAFEIMKMYNAKLRVVYTYDKLLDQVMNTITLFSSNTFNKKEEAEINKNLDIVANELKDLGKLQRNLRFVEYHQVKLGSECAKCKKTLGNMEHLRCRECEYALCYDCSLTEKHEHNMYYLKKDADTEVIFGPGANKTGKGDDNPTHQGVRCDCCSGPVAGIRWKCMKCQDVDICEKCFAATRNGQKDDNKSLYESAAKVSHNIDKHVLYRLMKNGSFMG
jgi:thiol-disulfide isomerase/thioredoxin